MVRKFFAISYQYLLKPIFFTFEPEKMHDMMTAFGNLLGRFAISRNLIARFWRCENPVLTQTIAGITFLNPVGLSAGFDKDAKLVSILPSVGFGFMQAGSVTDLPYEGNPQPRLYRLPKSKALVVYYGLKNEGVEKIIQRIKTYQPAQFALGVSIAKTNCAETADDEAGISDYEHCLIRLAEENIGDFYTINISCPNTFGGEPFTTSDKLDRLLARLTAHQITKPIFVKMPVDLSWNDFDALLKVITRYPITGVVIANLTKDRTNDLIKDPIPESIKGGISGKPTFAKSNELIAQTYRKYHETLTIIGVGGIFSAADAYEKIKQGASLVQLITGMVYQGPQLIGQINSDLVQLLEKDGYSSITEAVGAYHKK